MPDIGSAPNKSFQRTDGTRTGNEVWQEARDAPVKIRADAHDAHDADVADGISARWMRDGGNQPTADLPMGGFKFTGVGDAATRTAFPSVGQIQDGATIYAVSASNDTVTATLAPAITAYAAGQLFLHKAGGTNTGAMTLNENGAGAKAVKKGKAGSLALEAGDFAAGRLGLFAYDGTNFQLLNAPEFPTGTKMLFQQTAAPTGWTKDTTHNDKALRVVSGAAGTGGSVAFSTAFASKTPTGTIGGTAITEANLPAHKHFMFADDQVGQSALANSNQAQSGEGLSGDTGYIIRGTATAASIGLTSATGSGTTHTHSFTGDAINMAVAYVDLIIATKD